MNPPSKKCPICFHDMTKDWRKHKSHLWICRDCGKVV